MKDGKTLLGYCSVDSGQLLIADPCYIDKGFSYEEVCTAHTVGCDHSQDDPDGKHRHAITGEVLKDWGRVFHHGVGGPVLGGCVVTTTGFGDGSYPVWANVKDGRVMSVTITFVETNPT